MNAAVTDIDVPPLFEARKEDLEQTCTKKSKGGPDSFLIERAVKVGKEYGLCFF
ncbi:MAG: hypothetical protein QXY84_00665 [Candidatus Caldarchaeum sp.]